MGKPARKRSAERGAAAVEFALVLPVFMLLLLGTIDFGYFLFVSEVVTNAAREGARAGAVVDPDDGDSAAVTVAEGAASNYLVHGGLKNMGVSASTATVNGARSVEVQISYPVGSLTGLLSAIMPANSMARVVMRWD